MKFENQSVEPLMSGWGLQDIYDSICYAAATCYKSEPKQGEEAKTFVEKLITNGHLAMLEFGTVYLDIPCSCHFEESQYYNFYNKNPYSNVVALKGNTNNGGGRVLVTTNYRVIRENYRQNDLRWLVNPSKKHVKRYGFRITTSIGIARELTRHRVFSFAQESTRYVNYSKDKFGNEITFILPEWYENNNYTDMFTKNDFVNFCKQVENLYKAGIIAGAKPEQIREVLPLCTKTEICMCGCEFDWDHFFDLRLYGLTGRPHPEMLKLAEMLHNEYITNKI